VSRSSLTGKACIQAEGGGLGTIRNRCPRLCGKEPKFEVIGLELRESSTAFCQVGVNTRFTAP